MRNETGARTPTSAARAGGFQPPPEPPEREEAAAGSRRHSHAELSDGASSRRLLPGESWLLLNSGPCPPAFNMAMDEALLEAVVSLGRPVLRFYSWTEPAATFGYFQHYAEIARTTQLRPLIRRPTGGGLVPHDADWTYSVVIPPGHPWHALNAVDSYRRMHEWIRAAFARLGVATELADCCRKSAPGQCFVGWEKFDVLWQGRKIAGAAQRRNKLGLLIQGSVQPPPVGLERKSWETAMVSVEAGKTHLDTAPDTCRGTPSPPSEGGEGRGEEGRQSSEAPLSPALSPLVPRREREPESAVSRCAHGGTASLAELNVTPGLQDRVTGLAKERYSSAAYNERR